MYIKAVLSFLNGWQKLQDEHAAVFNEIKEAIKSLSFPTYSTGLTHTHRILVNYFEQLGWEVEIKTAFKVINNDKRRHLLDFIKNNVGVDFSFSKYPFVLRDLLFAYPRFFRAGIIRIAVVVVPMDEGTIFIPGVGNVYSFIYQDFADLRPIPLKYPFVVLGITENYSEIQINELTTELDTFLIETLDLSLEDMGTSLEREQYDFKATLSPNRPIYHLACALANQSGGGVILFGVNNTGNIVGFPRNELDALRNRLTSTIRSNCKPCPEFNILDFNNPSNPDTCVVIVHIRELDRKPCVADDKVYIRAGSETIVGGSEEIRRLVIRSLQ